MKLSYIEDLIDFGGGITVGPAGPVECAAVASRGSTCLAMLVRRREESLKELLARLDRAIKDADEQEIFVDEINP
ncbi:MAG: hypothetical protein KDB35_21975 [Acidimicrobiales bacterium]|nr:hypothetical protein [Acidimicrobiales bacterium]